MTAASNTLQYRINPEHYELQSDVLTPEAISFLVALHEHFNTRRKELLQFRAVRQVQIQQGTLPHFLTSTSGIRSGNWKVDAVPTELQDRKVEITGPVDRKMLINGLNSGAKVYMADFEDSTSPTWENVIQGQINLRDAINGTISHVASNGKVYQLQAKPAILFVRPRGWHMVEKNMEVYGEPMSASLFDFGLYFFHNALPLINRGSAPYFYLPKIESHLEARLWNDVFAFAQDYKDISQGTIKATVLIETIMAAFEMDEILFELRHHSAGLNCGRWDYIFSYIKKMPLAKAFVLPERSKVTMDVPFMKSYTELCIQTCHKRGAHAMGGMAAFIPIKNNEEANAQAIGKVRADKEREARIGHDGTWVAHPGLIPVALEVFEQALPDKPNQVDNKRSDVVVSAKDLLTTPPFELTPQGFSNNIDVAVQYIESWLRGVGCVPIYNLMEDAATAEISRSQLWQWIHVGGLTLTDGTPITIGYFTQKLAEVLQQLRQTLGDDVFKKGKYIEAAELLHELTSQTEFAEFLTTKAYQQIQ